MGLNIKNVGGGEKGGIKQPNIEPGTYPARLVQLIDLGLQPQRPYLGKDKPPAQEVMLTYELVDEFMKDEKGEVIPDKPRWISETLPFFGLQADKAKSTQRYNALDPSGAFGGDFSKLVGSPINVTIVNNAVGDRTYDNIATISTMRPKDADKCPKLINPSKVFDLDAPDMAVFASLPEWIRNKITENLNYAGSTLQGLLGVGSKEKPAPQRNSPLTPAAPENTLEKVDSNSPY